MCRSASKLGVLSDWVDELCMVTPFSESDLKGKNVNRFRNAKFANYNGKFAALVQS